MLSNAHADIIIVGGGLSGCLTAWLVKQRNPGLTLRLLERGTTLGGNHTWSFFETDLTDEQRAAVAPLVTSFWPGYRVRFPAYERELATGYGSIASSNLHTVIAAALGPAVILGKEVVHVATDQVSLSSGEIMHAPCVIDARGPGPTPHLALGFQKFLGLEVQLAAPHGVALPVIMDATVPQRDGYRFVYTLPLAADRVLIEDTYYSDDASVATEDLRLRIADFARQQGWRIAETIREELGVLPIILAGDIERHLSYGADGAPRIGLAAGFFHPTTGYSLPDALRVAMLLAAHSAMGGPITSASVRSLLAEHARAIWRERGYYRLLNRMMFRAGRPLQRYCVLERFYRLDAGLVQRFYAGRLTSGDRWRILLGRPPVPILPALLCVSEKRMLRRHEDA